MFQPITPLSGIAGWRFLERTQEAQQAAFDKSPTMAREIQYFKDNIANIGSAEELIADHTLFKVALGAFGLDEQINSKFFMRKILEEGTDDPSSLANRLVDKRFHDFSKAFGFGDLLGSRTGFSDFAQQITDAYKVHQFEIAVGDNDQSLRLAMTFKREISDYAAGSQSDNAAWFSIMGKTHLREVLEKAFGLPGSFGQLDIEKQRETLRDKTRDMLGSDEVAVFSDAEAVDKLVNRYLARTQIEQGLQSGSSGSAALTLLQAQDGYSASSQINLILSNA